MITKTHYVEGDVHDIYIFIHKYEELGWSVRDIHWHQKGALIVFEVEKIRAASSGEK